MEELKQHLLSYDLFVTEDIQALTPLAQQGHCNQNYLLTTQKTSYIVRIFGSESRNRVLEYRVQSKAYERGIAPEPIHLDIKNNLMIMAFSTGKHRKKLSQIELKHLAKTLRTLHSIQINTSQVTLDVDTSLLNTFDYDPVLCHNDLNPYNILWRDQIPTLIDWEYAGKNDRYFDLASVVVEFALHRSDIKVFIDRYFQADTWNREKLDTYIQVYHEVCEQWWNLQEK
jgi:Ser/Thr protein kinase RdoA (MazF antagonist)